MLLSLSASTLAAGLTLGGLRWKVHKTAEPLIRSLETLEASPVALIFGAYVNADGVPCPVLQDRLESGSELYHSGLVKKLIASGDHSARDYDEVKAMGAYLEKRGVNKDDIFLDHAGFDTYDSLYRAKAIFGAEDIVLVTQTFHLKRALFVGRSLGLRVQGFPSDRRRISQLKRLEAREVAANVKALWDILRKRQPAVLGQAVSLEGPGTTTHNKRLDGDL